MTVAERIDLIRKLCAHKGRRTGTDAERRVANVVLRKLTADGRRARAEPIHVHPQVGLIYGLHCIAAIVGSLIALLVPIAGFAVELLVAAGLYLDVNGRLYVLRRLLFRRASQNIVSTGRQPGASATLVLCAHLDAGRSGALYWARSVRAVVRLARRLRIPTGPFRFLFVAISLQLIPLGARMAGGDAAWIDVSQLGLIAVLLLAVFLLIDLELSGIGPGANDNASGVTTVLSVARVLDAEPPNELNVWVVVTGAEEATQEGMRAFLRAHREELDPATTSFINVDAVGRGSLRYEESAGWIVSYRMGGRLGELAEAIASSTAERDGDDVGVSPTRGGGDRGSPEGGRPETPAPLRRPSAGDSMPPRLAGYDALTITCRDELDMVPALRTFADVPDELDPKALESAHAFTLELVRQLDRDVSRRSRP